MESWHHNPVNRFGDLVLRGVSQVFLQDNWITGLLFLIGIFLNSFLAGIYALFGVVIATVTALLLGISRDSVRQGLYGFNGTLLGIALSLFLQQDLLLPVYVLVGSAFSSVVTAAIGGLLRQTPGLTAPFVLTTWLFIGALYSFEYLQPASALTAPVLPTRLIHNYLPLSFQDVLIGLLNGVGQVMLQQSVWTGIAFLIGLLVSSPIACAAALVGSLLGMLTAWLFGASASSLQAGLYGYNSVLTAIALGGVFYQLNWKTALFACFAAIVTAVVSGMLNTFVSPFGIPTLTAGFVLTTWLSLFGKSAFLHLLPHTKAASLLLAHQHAEEKQATITAHRKSQ